MRVLIIGGTGNISWHCVARAQQCGHKVCVMNRGETIKTRKALPNGVSQIYADIRDVVAVKKALDGMRFDVVVDFICYTPLQALIDVELFSNITKQFIFISSAACYQRSGFSACKYPITESAPLYSYKWKYAKNKIDCENIFMEHYEQSKFPITIVRPGHTYDTIIPDAVGNGDWTVAKRMIEGKPIIIHGDGTTLWTVTHSEDFARALVGLFHNSAAIGESFHITSDEWLTWRQISIEVANSLNAPLPVLIYIPSETIALKNPTLGAGLLGHKSWCDIYDNSKIKSVVAGWEATISFKEGIKRTVEWLEADKVRQRVDSKLDLFFDELVGYGK